MNPDSFSDTAPVWARLLVAILIIQIAYLLRVALLPVEGGMQYLTMYPAIVFSFYLCGKFPGIFSIILSAIIIDYALLPPYYSWALSSESIVSLSLYVFWSSAIGYALMRMHNYRRKIVLFEQNLLLQMKQQSEESIKLLIDGARLGIWRW